jgi:hypothetical protein
VVVRRFRALIETELAKGKLASAGIDSRIADDKIVRLDWFYSNAIGGLARLVNSDDADIARGLPDDHPARNHPGRFRPRLHPARCPNCDSLDVSFEILDRPISYTRTFLKVVFPVSQHNWKCQKCVGRSGSRNRSESQSRRHRQPSQHFCSPENLARQPCERQ